MPQNQLYHGLVGLLGSVPGRFGGGKNCHDEDSRPVGGIVFSRSDLNSIGSWGLFRLQIYHQMTEWFNDQKILHQNPLPLSRNERRCNTVTLNFPQAIFASPTLLKIQFRYDPIVFEGALNSVLWCPSDMHWNKPLSFPGLTANSTISSFKAGSDMQLDTAQAVGILSSWIRW